MDKHLKTFVAAHPDGWDHQAWLALLADLAAAGVDVTDPDGLGLALERERLSAALKRSAVPGLGAKRIDAIADQFGSLVNLRRAAVEDIANIKTISPALAEQVAAAVR